MPIRPSWKVPGPASADSSARTAPLQPRCRSREQIEAPPPSEAETIPSTRCRWPWWLLPRVHRLRMQLEGAAVIHVGERVNSVFSPIESVSPFRPLSHSCRRSRPSAAELDVGFIDVDQAVAVVGVVVGVEFSGEEAGERAVFVSLLCVKGDVAGRTCPNPTGLFRGFFQRSLASSRPNSP